MDGGGEFRGFALPSLPEWARNALIGLFALYAIELFLANVLRLPVHLLTWWPMESPSFRMWQPFTRYLVQGNEVISVVLAGVILYFFLPAMGQLLRLKQLVEVVAFAFAGGTLLAAALDLMGVLRDAPGSGWGPIVTACVVLYGLSMPNAVIRLFFVLPVPASIFVWGTGVFTGLMLLATLVIGTADHFGTFLGVMTWWHLRGPGARRRRLLKESSRIESELRRFEVIEGGRRAPNRGDDEVH